LHNMAEKPPKDFLTVNQWAKKWDYDTSYCRKVLRKMVDRGMFERRTYRIPINGFPTSTNHFGPFEKK
jgi:predicted transcriptional regulator